jgi:transposase
MKLIRVGVDLAKNVFQVHGVDRSERVVWRRRLRREQWIEVVRERAEPGCEIGMEACAGAHHWARELQKLGFKVKLIAPQFVKPYVKSNKNDAADAEAICEAMARPGMRFVPIKNSEQQDLQALHRVRASLIAQRTGKANQIRGLVAEYGLVAPRELVQLRRALPRWLEDRDNGLSAMFRRLLERLRVDLVRLDERVTELDREVALVAKLDPSARELARVRGIGPVSATALVANVGNARHFSKARHMAASLGITPRQHSSGGRERMLGISKRGDAYLRSLLIHGARAVIRTAKGKDDPLSKWVTRLAERRHPNVAAVALANKNARIAWAILSRATRYRAAV